MKQLAKWTLVPLFFTLSAVALFAADWKPAEGILLSKFSKDVDSTLPLPEYPRPQLTRENWANLNGLWDYAIVPAGTSEGEFAPILVPFPVESALSGVAKTVGKESELLYKRSFHVPEKWAGKRVILHFGAVDWRTTVSLNGKEIGSHEGGYSPFSFDITDALVEGNQKLEIRVWDPTSDGPQPRGKQINNPHGIWYTAVTGIWQTVWIEPVAEAHITKVLPVSNVKEKKMTFTVSTAGAADGMTVKICGAGSTGEAKVENGKATLEIAYPNAEFWTPNNPKLYNIDVQLLQDGKKVDCAGSYFGMREITLGKGEDGITRMLLNGEFVFQQGPLDQGWWPDGLYRAPTDEALRYDVEMTKAFGFNMLRKHVKTEPARFYRHCDELGIMVWQDMPSGDKYIAPEDPDYERTPEAKAIYEKEYAEMIDTLDVYPSIVMWVPFNEGWGQFDTCRIVDWTKQLDPTRLVDCASGWSDRPCGSVHDMHKYPGPGMPEPEENRAVVLGEYGGLGLPVKGHSWNEEGRNWGYVKFEDKEGLFQRYKQLNRALHPLIARGLSAAVYTQTTDVEIEVNGLMSYDREVIKMPVEKLYESNQALHQPAPELSVVLPDSREVAQLWKYTAEAPAENWAAADFDDSAWKEGPAGFGQGAPNTFNNTEWKSGDIWIRKSFDLEVDEQTAENLILQIYHDEDAQVYLNGEEVCSLKGYSTDYVQADMNIDAVKKALKNGRNVIAVHVKQTAGGQYIDLSLGLEIPHHKKLIGGQRPLPPRRRGK